ncbi:hypothetical protein [Enterococcus viikkiensis]|uniref:hypothetical protein n=1 Tax=Enterococcus viikkiensis TaxID=930854 RepID=UPI0010F6C9C9|nr:hypothetical protein [Enterococcus viikkiensis]
MVAQQKKNGWFFNKNIIDEINAVPKEKVEKEDSAKAAPTLKMVADNTVSDSPDKQIEEIKELKRLIFEKEQVLQKYKKEMTVQNQQLTKENENYRQSVLRMGEEKAQNRRQIQDLETEIQRARQEIKRLKNSQELEELRQQLDETLDENKQLTASVEHLATVEQELEDIHEEHKALVSQQKDEEVQRLEKVKQLEEQIEDLLAEINEKEEHYSQLDQVILEKDQMIEQIVAGQDGQANEDQLEEVSELKEQLAYFEAENAELKQEAVATQLEIGEVLISARKQANRMVEKSKMDAHRIIGEAKKELALINEQAREISEEISESRHSVMALYEEIQTRVEILAQGKIQAATKNESDESEN